MSKRKLCSIQVIDRIENIENADKIVKVGVLGWELVAEKGLYNVGDKAIFCEVDTVLPEIPATEFMRSYRFRVRTIKLRGQISQGLLLPLSVLEGADSMEVGTEVTELLGAKKYEPNVPGTLGGTARGTFPVEIPKTDEERIQSNPSLLKSLVGKEIYITEKLDGTSFTAYMIDGKFGVCSRNMDLHESEDNVYWQIAKEYDLQNKLSTFTHDVAIQGEIVGEGVQKNPLKLIGKHLYLFNIFNIAERKYYDFVPFTEKVKELGLTTVPILHVGELAPGTTLEDLILNATRTSVLNSRVLTEGIVVRTQELVNQERVSFKVISPEYLLKND